MKYFFLGQDNFGNRGCEALIRSSVKLIRETDPEAVFIVPSGDIKRDSEQWPEHRTLGVSFCDPEPFPSAVRWWGRLQRRVPLARSIAPSYTPTQQTRESLESSDVIIMTGGDIISLDYGLESLFYWCGLCDFAISRGKKVVLSAASVGPFSKEKRVESIMLKKLRRFSLITVREQASLTYLTKNGVNGVQLVGDPAFCLDANGKLRNEVERKKFEGHLGLNVSPLIEKFKAEDQDDAHITREICGFIEEIVNSTPIDIALLTHVDPLDQSGGYNSDYSYMLKIYEKAISQGIPKERIHLLPRELNCEELKYVLSSLKYFIGARTHATIGAMSKGTPTISIAYSVKASGINNMIFGHDRYVLPTPKISKTSLLEYFSRLKDEEESIRSTLNTRMPEIQLLSRENFKLIKRLAIAGAI
jgi:colanic acid/amylovoran biosynthesis protein